MKIPEKVPRYKPSSWYNAHRAQEYPCMEQDSEGEYVKIDELEYELDEPAAGRGDVPYIKLLMAGPSDIAREARHRIVTSIEQEADGLPTQVY